MKYRRRWMIGLLVCVMLASAWLEPTHCTRGWLRGEAFYNYRPTSYWAAEIELWEPTGKCWIRGGRGRKEHAPRRILPEFLARYLPLPPPEWPSLLDGDPEALPVLQDLAEYPSEHVSEWAKEGIDRITTGDKGPSMRVWFWGERVGTGGTGPPMHLSVQGEIGP